MEVLVVGAGAMGRWFADVIDAEVAVADLDGAAARETADAVGGRVVPLEPDRDPPADGDGAETFDAVCLAVPMDLVEAAIATHASRADGAILDVAGVMEPAVAAMADHAPGLEHCSLHPLFAPARAPGSVAVVAPSPGPVTDRILTDIEAAGNELVETTAAEHDDAMASVQAATHAAVIAFGLASEPVPKAFETPVYAALREQIERVASGTPRVYADIQSRFDGAEAVAKAAERVADADDEELAAVLAALRTDWDAGAEEENGAAPTGEPPAGGESS